MMPRETAAAIISSLERALDLLLRVRATCDSTDVADPVRAWMDDMWVPRANTALLLAAINEAYPDLEGPETVFEAGSEESAKALSEGEMMLIRADLSEARDLLEQVAATIRAAPGVDLVEKERLMVRFEESIAALREDNLFQNKLLT